MKLPYKIVFRFNCSYLVEYHKEYSTWGKVLKRLAEVTAPRRNRKTRRRFYPFGGTFAFIRKY